MKGDETMKQIMKRGLKLFLVLCLMIESFSAVPVKAAETADKGRTVKIYVNNMLVESKWYNYGEKIQLPKYYERVQDDGVKVVDFIREWEWYRQWEDSSNTRVVDETPDIILTSDFSYSDENETQIDGTTCVYKEDEDKAKVLVKIYIGVSVYKQMLYNPGEKIRLPE